MLVDSPYTKLMQSKDQLDHVGYDYKDKILSRTMSRIMFRTNDTMRGFLFSIQSVVYELVECVKRIKTFANPALDKNERRII